MSTWRAEGATGVWRGYQPSLAGITSYVAGYFIFYEGARRWMESKPFFQEHKTLTHLIAGGFGGGLTATLATRFGDQSAHANRCTRPRASFPFPCFTTKATIRDAEGWRGAMHRALATLSRIMFAVYEATSVGNGSAQGLLASAIRNNLYRRPGERTSCVERCAGQVVECSFMA